MTTEQVTRCDFCKKKIEEKSFYKIYATTHDGTLADFYHRGFGKVEDICGDCWSAALEVLVKRKE